MIVLPLPVCYNEMNRSINGEVDFQMYDHGLKQFYTVIGWSLAVQKLN